MYSGDLDISHYLRISPVILHYFGDFIGELLKANLDVARRVVHPDTPISPEVLEIPLRVESGPAVTTLANSITLTPGTLTLDYSSDRNGLYVHAINGGSEEEEIRETIQNWEDMLVKIFDNKTVIEADREVIKK
jgi:multicomponent Na+:H+ antiporter subunit E